MTSQFKMQDTKKADGLYIRFERIEQPDQYYDPREYLFQDKDYAKEDQERLNAFNSGEWEALGIIARAHIQHVCNGAAFNTHIDSPGLWGIESDSGEEYFAETYQDQIESLKATIAAIAQPIYEGK